MSENEYGESIGEDTLRFTRRFDALLERVWQALVTPERLGLWLGRATVEARAGGRFEIDFDGENRMDGRILTLESPHRLVLAWHEISDGKASKHATSNNDESRVSFELSAHADGGTMLVFTHCRIRRGDGMIGFGAGWHAHLAALGAAINGSHMPDRDELYERLRGPYEARLNAGVAR
jgi:uncharacterized protein YndB with AHSA1/START domain